MLRYHGTIKNSKTPNKIRPWDDATIKSPRRGDRVERRGLRLGALPHHWTCGFPHPAIERSHLFAWCGKVGWNQQLVAA
jgi:hypothetical protein